MHIIAINPISKRRLYLLRKYGGEGNYYDNNGKYAGKGKGDLKIPKLVLNADNLVGLLRENNGKMLAKVLLRRFENIKRTENFIQTATQQFV